MKVRYVGVFDAVDVPLPAGHTAGLVATVPHGGELATSDEHAKQLLEQPDNWQPVAKPARAGKE